MKDFDGNAPYPRVRLDLGTRGPGAAGVGLARSRDQSHRDAIGHGVSLIVGLIEARGKRPDFDPWDPPHGDD